jgi:hypothetical protein
MGTMGIEYSILLKNVKEGEYQEIPELDGRIVLRYTLNFEVRHPRCVEPKLLNGKSTVKTQLFLLAKSGWIT